MAFALDPDIRVKLDKLKTNRGAQFMSGNPTTIFQDVLDNSVAQLKSDASKFVNDAAKAGTTAAIGMADMAVTGAIASNSGLTSAVGAAADTLGAVASVTTTASVLSEAPELIPEVAKSLATTLMNDVMSYVGTKTGEAAMRVLALPSVADITGKAMSYMKEHLKSGGDILKMLTTNAEDQAKDASKEGMKNQVADIKDKATKTLGDISEKVSEYTKKVQEWSDEITAYITEGPDWVEAKMKKYEDIAFGYIGKFVNEKVQFIEDQKQIAVNFLADGLAKEEAELANKLLEKTTKKNLDKVKQAKQKVVNVAKAKVGAALLKLFSQIGM